MRLLAISPLTEDHVALARIFSHSSWEVRHALTYDEALEQLHASTLPVILTERDLPPFSWKDILNSLAEMTNPSRVIVASATTHARLWGEVLNLGAYDLLSKPFDSKEVFGVISAAWRDWKYHQERGNFRCAGVQYR